MNLDEVEEKVDSLFTWVEVAVEVAAALLLSALIFGLIFMAITHHASKPIEVSNQKPPRVCGQVGPMTVYC